MKKLFLTSILLLTATLTLTYPLSVSAFTITSDSTSTTSTQTLSTGSTTESSTVSTSTQNQLTTQKVNISTLHGCTLTYSSSSDSYYGVVNNVLYEFNPDGTANVSKVDYKVAKTITSLVIPSTVVSPQNGKIYTVHDVYAFSIEDLPNLVTLTLPSGLYYDNYSIIDNPMLSTINMRVEQDISEVIYHCPKIDQNFIWSGKCFNSNNEEPLGSGVTIGSFEYVFTGNHTVSLSRYFSSYTETSVEVPSTVTYRGVTYTVTAINHLCFSTGNSVKSIVLPTTIKKIDPDSFDACYGLTNVTLPAGINLSGVFLYCDKLTNSGITFNTTTGDSQTDESSKAIVNSAEECNIYLNGIWYKGLSNGTASVYYSIIETRDSLVNVDIPSQVTDPSTGKTYTVTVVDENAFIKSPNLVSVTLPDTIVSVSHSAFCWDDNFTNLSVSSKTFVDAYAVGNSSKFDRKTGLTIRQDSTLTTPTSSSADTSDNNTLFLLISLILVTLVSMLKILTSRFKVDSNF